MPAMKSMPSGEMVRVAPKSSATLEMSPRPSGRVGRANLSRTVNWPSDRLTSR